MTDAEMQWAKKYAQEAHAKAMGAHPTDAWARASSLVDAVFASGSSFRSAFTREPPPGLAVIVKDSLYGLEPGTNPVEQK